MLNSFTQYRSLGPGFCAIDHFFLQWWGRGRGPVGQMPHQCIVLKNALHIRRVAKNKMAVQKLHEFCEAEKRKIFALRKIIVQGKTLKKI